MILPKKRSKNDIQLLADAIEAYPHHKVISWSRSSTQTQCKRGALDRQRIELRDEIQQHNVTPWLQIRAQESGRMSEDRCRFRNTIRRAERCSSVLVAIDFTRFLRAEAGEYSEPSQFEWLKFWSIIGDVPVATVRSPTLSVLDLHSLRTKRGMAYSAKRPGRPTKLTFEMVRRIFCLRGYDDERTGMQLGVRQIANRLGITPRQVQTALDFRLPNGRQLKSFRGCMNFPSQFSQLDKRGVLDELKTRLRSYK